MITEQDPWEVFLETQRKAHMVRRKAHQKADNDYRKTIAQADKTYEVAMEQKRTP